MKNSIKKLYYIIFLVSLITLSLEITLTRIFSVTMWYHYAFMAISIAMLGMSTGAVTVFARRYGELSHEKIRDKIASYATFFAFSILLSLFILLSVPFVPRMTGIGIFTQAFLFTVSAIPFYASGVIIALILTTRYMDKINTLYAADLAGAAVGTILFFVFMSLTDALSFVIFLAAVASGVAWYTKKSHLRATTAIIILIFAVWNHTSSLIKIEWSKVETGALHASIEQNIEWERWTPFSRITVSPNSDSAFGWGISPTFYEEFPTLKIPQKQLVIDSAAGTIITGKKYDISELHHLRFDITNMAHYFVHNGRVAVIGVGGGRDLLSALYFDQKEVWGIEINKRILQAITEEYKDFTYPFATLPKVHLVHDEARSFIERSSLKFDIIQASLIDSWAATASGAFVLTENSLYTVEAWKIFLNHLTDNGILTMSRWYFKKRPGEMLRLANLAWTALEANGVKDPASHIMIVGILYHGPDIPVDKQFGTGTILVSKKPFTAEQRHTLKAISKRFKFDVIVNANIRQNSIFSDILNPKERDSLLKTHPLNLYAPTDDSPFFFNTLRPLSLFSYGNIDSEGPLSTNLKAVSNLFVLLAILIILVLLFILAPLWIHMENSSLAMILNPHTLYFAAIGMGFMLIEIALIQRFTVFLGHPTWSIVVVLFSILLFTGVGSRFSATIWKKYGKTTIFIALFAILLTIGLFNMIYLSDLSSTHLAVRLLYAFVTMALIGAVLGMPFPTGMQQLAETGEENIAPWLWGINGAFGVVSSVFATIISLFFGISITFFAGLASYGFALVALLLIRQKISHKK